MSARIKVIIPIAGIRVEYKFLLNQNILKWPYDTKKKLLKFYGPYFNLEIKLS